MSACIEEHYRKHHKDYKVIRLIVVGHIAYSDWEKILYDYLKSEKNAIDTNLNKE
jgi:hypothetical protein